MYNAKHWAWLWMQTIFISGSKRGHIERHSPQVLIHGLNGHQDSNCWVNCGMDSSCLDVSLYPVPTGSYWQLLDGLNVWTSVPPAARDILCPHPPPTMHCLCSSPPDAFNTSPRWKYIDLDYLLSPENWDAAEVYISQLTWGVAQVVSHCILGILTYWHIPKLCWVSICKQGIAKRLTTFLKLVLPALLVIYYQMSKSRR